MKRKNLAFPLSQKAGKLTAPKCIFIYQSFEIKDFNNQTVIFYFYNKVQVYCVYFHKIESLDFSTFFNLLIGFNFQKC